MAFKLFNRTERLRRSNLNTVCGVVKKSNFNVVFLNGLISEVDLKTKAIVIDHNFSFSIVLIIDRNWK